MPPMDALRSLREAIADNPAVGVLLASEPGQELILQRLNLREGLAAEFLAAARDAVPAEDVVLRPYDPGYKPDRGEICYVELEEHEDMQELLRSISQVQQAEIFRERDEVVDASPLLCDRVKPQRPQACGVSEDIQPQEGAFAQSGICGIVQPRPV